MRNTVRTGGDRLPPLDRHMLGRLVDEGAISPQDRSASTRAMSSAAGRRRRTRRYRVSTSRRRCLAARRRARRLPRHSRRAHPGGSRGVAVRHAFPHARRPREGSPLMADVWDQFLMRRRARTMIPGQRFRMRRLRGSTRTCSRGGQRPGVAARPSRHIRAQHRRSRARRARSIS